MLENLLDTPTLTVAHDPAMHSLHVTWSGRHDPAQTMRQCALLLGFVQTTHARYILHDGTRSLDGWHEITGWLGHDFLPQLADHGIRAVAWVYARDWPTRTVTDQMLSLVTRPLVDVFADVQAAHAWLATLS